MDKGIKKPNLCNAFGMAVMDKSDSFFSEKLLQLVHEHDERQGKILEEIHRMLKWLIISKIEQYRNLINYGIGERESQLPDISDIVDKKIKQEV